MAKLEIISPSNLDIFNEVLDGTTIPKWVNFKLLSNDKQKEVIKPSKANDILETIGNGLNFVIIINEGIFDQLDESMQRMVIDECLAGVRVSESETISYEKPNVCTYRGVLEKYGHDEVIVMKESIKSLYDEKEEMEKQIKESQKGKRRGSRNI